MEKLFIREVILKMLKIQVGEQIKKKWGDKKEEKGKVKFCEVEKRK